MPRLPLDPELRSRLQAEANAPYRGLRRFAYAAIAASGSIGAFIFFTKAIAGQNLADTLPNLALQVGIVALMAWFFRLEQRSEQRAEQRTKPRSPQASPTGPGDRSRSS